MTRSWQHGRDIAQPHWYLLLLAVDPPSQGCEVGSWLMSLCSGKPIWPSSPSGSAAPTHARLTGSEKTVEVVAEAEVECTPGAMDRQPEETECVQRLRTIAALVVIPGIRSIIDEFQVEEVFLHVVSDPHPKHLDQPHVKTGFLAGLPDGGVLRRLPGADCASRNLEAGLAYVLRSPSERPVGKHEHLGAPSDVGDRTATHARKVAKCRLPGPTR